MKSEQTSASTQPASGLLSHWNLARVAEITSGEVDPAFAEQRFAPICTDSRALRPGEYFLALRGEKFDGHTFVERAAKSGAAGVIVDRAYYDKLASLPDALKGIPVLRVDDTLRAYGDLGAARRAEWMAQGGKKVLAISGSAGKTTTRRLVAEALSRHRRVLEPERNFNNLIGLPQTLLKLEDAHEIAVLELGMNQPGELKRLTEIAQPSAAILTQIGLAHIGMFKSMQDLVNAKLDLFRGCAPQTPLAANATCPRTTMSLTPFFKDHRIVLFKDENETQFGLEADVAVENVRPLAPVGYTFDLRLPGKTLANLELNLFGRHHLANVAAAAALLLAAGEPPEWIAEALPNFKSEPLRGERIEAGGMALIVDCYNASPPSMLSALESLGETQLLPGGRRIIVLADMLELGEQSLIAHQMLLGPLRKLAPAIFFGLGPRCQGLASALANEGWTTKGFLDRKELIAALKKETKAGDSIFFKGSHGFGLEYAAEALMGGPVDE